MFAHALRPRASGLAKRLHVVPIRARASRRHRKRSPRVTSATSPFPAESSRCCVPQTSAKKGARAELPLALPAIVDFRKRRRFPWIVGLFLPVPGRYSDCCRTEHLVDGGATIVQESLIKGRGNMKSKGNASKVGSIGKAFECRQGLGVGAFEINLRACTDETRNALAHQSRHDSIAVPTRLKFSRIKAKFEAVISVLVACR
jgi:hypothetical protein